MSADAGSLHTICRVLFWVFRFDQILVIALYFALHFDQIPSCTQYRRNLFYFQASNGFQPFFNTDQLSWRPSAVWKGGAAQLPFRKTNRTESTKGALPSSYVNLRTLFSISIKKTHSRNSRYHSSNAPCPLSMDFANKKGLRPFLPGNGNPYPRSLPARTDSPTC